MKTNIKVGGLRMNHNETVAKGLKVKTNVKAGGITGGNHNETLAKGLRVKTNVKAGGRGLNHNETLVHES